jgi:hypothetical protein
MIVSIRGKFGGGGNEGDVLDWKRALRTDTWNSLTSFTKLLDRHKIIGISRDSLMTFARSLNPRQLDPIPSRDPLFDDGMASSIPRHGVTRTTEVPRPGTTVDASSTPASASVAPKSQSSGKEQQHDEQVRISDAGLMDVDRMGLRDLARKRLPQSAWVDSTLWDKLDEENLEVVVQSHFERYGDVSVHGVGWVVAPSFFFRFTDPLNPEPTNQPLVNTLHRPLTSHLLSLHGTLIHTLCQPFLSPVLMYTAISAGTSSPNHFTTTFQKQSTSTTKSSSSPASLPISYSQSSVSQIRLIVGFGICEAAVWKRRPRDNGLG